MCCLGGDEISQIALIEDRWLDLIIAETFALIISGNNTTTEQLYSCK